MRKILPNTKEVEPEDTRSAGEFIMEQGSLLEFLGFEPSAGMEGTEKRENERNKKGSEAKQGRKKGTPKEYVSFPVKVVTGYARTVTYQPEEFGKDEVTAKEVFEKFTSQNPSFPSSLCSFYTRGKDTIVVSVKRLYCSSKLVFKAGKRTKYLLGDIALDLSSFMADTECEISAAKLIEAFRSEYPEFGPIGICYSKTEDVAIPCFLSNALYGSIQLPADVVFWNHEGFTVTEESLGHLQEEGGEGQEGGDSEEAEGQGVVSKKLLLKAIEEHYPEYRGMLQLLYNEEERTVVVAMKEGNGSPASEQKETMYPTDAEVSLFVHIRFKLSPEMFGGKTEISEKEFKAFLEERYPEFSPERTFIMYDEAKKIIMPGLKSSSKGVLSLACTDEEEEKLKASPFPFLRSYGDGSIYRVESTPVADFRICMNGNKTYNSFDFSLPKIPFSMVIAAGEFFSRIYRESGTEVLLQLFYREGAYFWHLPVQTASEAAVTAERNPLLERSCLLVADFHSHGKFPAFWSETDSADEKGSRIYGVMGSFGAQLSGRCDILYRAGCGGYFTDLDGGSIVNYQHKEESLIRDTLDFLLKRKGRILTGNGSFVELQPRSIVIQEEVEEETAKFSSVL